MQNEPKCGSVLVVEDSAAERETLLVLLRRAGYTARGVGDARSALAALDETEASVDVVLCDLRLKVSNETGVDLLRQWKLRRPSTPFIFVTGVCEIAQVVEAVKLGAEDYITKPYNSAELLRRVAECVDAANDVTAPPASRATEQGRTSFEIPPGVPLEEIERMAIEAALNRTSGNRTRAAEELGVSVRTLQRKLKTWAVVESVRVNVLTKPRP